MTTIHTAAPPKFGGLFQDCSRCGHVLQDYTSSQPMALEDQADLGIPTWPVGQRIAVWGNATWLMPGNAEPADDETECRPTS